ncbi:MAG: hypothetical protein HYY17_10190, partial [Planctomycetes bacterium]|nr:hypothetical protein [Planctomycetota bacterium]
GEPLRDRKYRLTVGASVREGRIPQDGLVEQEVPADAREGTLTLWLRGDPEGPGFDVKLDIGALDPHDTVSGLQARLYNMGLYDGAIDGQDSEELQAAVRKFRESTGGPEERDLNSQVKDRYGR